MASKEVSTYSVQDPTSGVSALGVDASGEVKRFNLGSAANRSVGTGAAAIPLNSDLGTAAVEDVQTSLTDTTADRLMKVGAFGLGLSGAASSVDNLDELTATGVYAFGATTLNIPFVGAFGNCLLYIRNSVSGGHRSNQIAITASDRMFLRTNSGGV